MKRVLSSSLVRVLLTLCLLATSLTAKTAAVERIYLPIGVVDAEALIGPPPAPGSVELAEDLAIVLWMQETRTADQIELAESQEDFDLDDFAEILAKPMTRVNAIELRAALKEVIEEVKLEYEAIKAHYARARPYRQSELVHPVFEHEGSKGYPSGHSTRGMIYALLLADVFPEQKDTLIEYGRHVGYNRVLVGVHFPSDVRAGQKLGTAYAEAILKQPGWADAKKRILGE